LAAKIVPQEEDECNLINKEDFEEGKTKEIVTSRGTPIKANAMERKNMSTSRQQSKGRYGFSPSIMLNSAVEYQDPNNPSNLYYQIVNNFNPSAQPNRIMS
jgi:hypothetical protein